ncbi:MAG: lytic murein transglycosylase [Pseudomonadota bacterium]
MRVKRLILGISLAMAAAPASAQGFDAFLADLRAEAIAQGVRPATADATLRGLRPSERVIALDRRQPEFSLSFWRYFETAVSERRVADGQAQLARHRPRFERASAASGVPPEVLAAFWGLETAYGASLGDFDMMRALTTLAHDPRRARFFRAQAIAAMRIIDSGDLPVGARSSWAGAFGQMQFMPETFLRAAVDGDGDRRRDLMRNLDDAFHSAGALLRADGWRPGERWGREVRLPDGFDYRRLERPAPLADWAAAGVRRADGRPLAVAAIEARLLLPAGATGPAFLAYPNFEAILRWNRSTLYALAIGHLSDRIAGRPDLSMRPPANERRLRVDDIARIQAKLVDRGFNPGPIDGKAGPSTRAAIRAFQSAIGVISDGHPSPTLLDQLAQ